MVGVAAAVLAFGLTVAVTIAEPGSDDGGGTDVELEEDPGWVDAYGWLFFSTHFVEVEASVTADTGQQASQTFDLVEEETDLPAIIYRLIPVLSLTAVGYLFARFSLDDQARPSDGIRAGGLLTAGYLPAVVAGLLLFAHRTGYVGGVVSYSVPFLPGLAIAGIVYPVVFGGLGGYLAHRAPDV